MNDTVIKFAGEGVSIRSFGTDNPKVQAFLQASFALEGMGGLSQAQDAQAQAVGNALRTSGISLN